MTTKNVFKKKYLILGVLFIIAGLSISLVKLPAVQKILLPLCERVKGSPLNIENVIQKFHSFIIMNTLLFVAIGAGFLMVNFINFDTEEETEKLKIFSKSVFKSKRLNCALILTFLFLLGIRAHWATQKANWHQDELYGIGIANISEYNFWTGKKFPNYKAFTGSQIKDAVFFDDASVKDVSNDIGKLWFYNNDTAYTSLYLMLFRLAFFGVKTYDFSAIVFRGILLNLIFFCLAFYLLLRTLDFIGTNSFLTIVILLLAFSTKASISNSLYIREYAFQEAELLLFAHMFIFYLKSILEGNKVASKSNFIKTTVLTGLVLSTSYFTLFFIAISGIFLLACFFCKKRTNECIFLTSAFLLSILCAKILYLNWGSTLLVGRGQEAFEELSAEGAFARNISLFNDYLVGFSWNYAIYIAIAISIIALLMLRKSDSFFNCAAAFSIAFLSIVWIAFVTYITPSKSSFYVLPAYTMLSLFAFPICSLMDESKEKKLERVLATIILILAVLPVLPFERNKKNINHLTDTLITHSSPEFLSDTSKPLVIYSKSSYPEILPYLADEQTCWFADSVQDAITNIKELPNEFWYIECVYHELPYRIELIKRNTN